jgi:hypothetical protein
MIRTPTEARRFFIDMGAAVARDLQSDKHALDDYRRAHALLRQGDYYILVMIDRALGRRLRPWWKFPQG